MSEEIKDETVTEEVVEETQDEAVKSILEAVEARVASGLEIKTAEIKKELNEQVKAWEARQTDSKAKAVSFDNEAFDAWAKSVKDGAKGDFSFEIKDIGAFVKSDMGVGTNFTGDVSLSEIDPVISRDPQRSPFIEQLVSVGSINAPIDTWMEVIGENGEPATIAELAEYPNKDYSFEEKTANVKKVGVHSKYSKEMADDLPNVVSEVRNFLLSDLRRKIDAQILSGDGTGTNLTGILANATAFAAGDLAGTVDDANNFDVIEAAATQVITGLHNPNVVVVNPVDAAKMNLTKGTDGHYVMPPFITAGGATVSGLRVVSNTGIPAGDFLVGDFSKSSVKYRQGVTVELSNSDQDDFIKDRFTIKASARLVHRVRANDYGAFVYGTFSTAAAALETA